MSAAAELRICSLFSSATELVYALGAGRSIVGRSEHCDYPTDALKNPIVVRSRIASDRLTSRGIHEAVEGMCTRKEHHYDLDLSLLKELKPNLLITQELCNVCAASHPEVEEVARKLDPIPRIIAVNARRFEELFGAIEILGQQIERVGEAKALTDRMRQEVDQVLERLEGVKVKPRVWCAEWLDPLISAGHWLPELVEMAGGSDGMGKPGEDSVRVTWDDVRQYDPEVIIVMPCSFSMDRTVKEMLLLTKRPGWNEVSAVQKGRVFTVESAYFHRPGPRLVKGLELMASLFHPELFQTPTPEQARSVL